MPNSKTPQPEGRRNIVILHIAFAFAFSCYWNVIYIGNVLKTYKLRLVKSFTWFGGVKVSVQYLRTFTCTNINTYVFVH